MPRAAAAAAASAAAVKIVLAARAAGAHAAAAVPREEEELEGRVARRGKSEGRLDGPAQAAVSEVQVGEG